MPLAIEVLVAGRKMQRDFEGILERQIHRWLQPRHGLHAHRPARPDLVPHQQEGRSRPASACKHLGTILYAKLHDEYGGHRRQGGRHASPASRRGGRSQDRRGPRRPSRIRDDRIAGHDRRVGGHLLQLHDLPELRPGPRLRDHAAAAGPVRRVQLARRPGQLTRSTPPAPTSRSPRAARIDAAKGEWEGVNKFVYQHSNHKIERFCAYSLLESPMTSCGCFECIVAVLPLANGVMVVNREYPGMTPCGMSFGDAGRQRRRRGADARLRGRRPALPVQPEVPRGRRRPAAAGVDAQGAQGSHPRPPREAGAEEGLNGFVDKIGDETKATTADQLVEHLTTVGHPALSMDPLF